MFAFLKPYALGLKIGAVLALAAAVVAGLFWFGADQRAAGRNQVQAAWDRATAVAQEARSQRVAAARRQEAALQAAADEDRRNRDARIQAADARVAALERRLRERPARPQQAGPADVRQPAAGPGTAGGCTGARLYRDDGLFLAGQARMCQRIREQRDDYWRAYQRAREALKRQAAGE